MFSMFFFKWSYLCFIGCLLMDFSWKYVFKVASIMCDVIVSDDGFMWFEWYAGVNDELRWHMNIYMLWNMNICVVVFDYNMLWKMMDIDMCVLWKMDIQMWWAMFVSISIYGYTWVYEHVWYVQGCYMNGNTWVHVKS